MTPGHVFTANKKLPLSSEYAGITSVDMRTGTRFWEVMCCSRDADASSGGCGDKRRLTSLALFGRASATAMRGVVTTIRKLKRKLLKLKISCRRHTTTRFARTC